MSPFPPVEKALSIGKGGGKDGRKGGHAVLEFRKKRAPPPVPETSLHTLCFPTDFLLLAGTEPRGKTENPFVSGFYFPAYLLLRTS